MTSEDLIIILEQGYRTLPNALGNFLQLGGARVTVDASKEPFKRIVPHSVFINEIPLCLKKTYRVAAVSFMSKGKDGFTHFKNVECLGHGKKEVTIKESILETFNLEKIFVQTMKRRMSDITNDDIDYKLKKDRLQRAQTESIDIENYLKVIMNTHIRKTIMINQKNFPVCDFPEDGRIRIINRT